MPWDSLERMASRMAARMCGGKLITFTDPSGQTVQFTGNFIESFQMIEAGADGADISTVVPVVRCGLEVLAGVDVVPDSRVDVAGVGAYYVSHANYPGFQDVILILHKAAA